MPDVPYILGGEPVTAERMNALFQEADRRIALGLDDHALAYVLVGDSTLFHASTTREAMRRWMANCFSFGIGRNVAGMWTDAEHTDADFTAQPIRAWHQAELLFEGKTDYDFPAHYTRFNFFRLHNCNNGPLTVRFKKTDGSTALSVTVPAYGSRCVRRVDGSYTLGFKYFQRFLPGDVHTYCQGGFTRINFQSAISIGISNNVFAPQTLLPLIHILAGGKWSNGGLDSWSIEPVLGLDPSVRAPLPTRSAALYGDASSDATLIGDLLHHKGEWLDFQSTGLGIGGNPVVNVVARRFNGYATIVEDMAEQGVMVERVGEDLKLTAVSDGKQHDAAATGTNLFSTGEPQGGEVLRDLSAGVTLDRHVPNRAFEHLRTVSGMQLQSYLPIIGDGIVDVANPVSFNFEGGSLAAALTDGFPFDSVYNSPCAIVTNRHTVASVKNNLMLFCGDAATLNSAYSNGLLMLSSTGLWIVADHTISLKRPLANRPYIWNSLSPAFDSEDRFSLFTFTANGDMTGSVSEKRVINFGNYGWPNDDVWNDYSHTTGNFLAPGAARYYGLMSPNNEGRTHPDFIYSETGPDIAYSASKLEPQPKLSALTPLLKNGNSVFATTFSQFQSNAFVPPGVLSNTDVLRGLIINSASGGFAPWYRNERGRLLANILGNDSVLSYPNGSNKDGIFDGFACLFHRPQMAAEHFNNLAAKVNSISRYRPLNFVAHGWLPLNTTQRARPQPGGWRTQSTDRSFLFTPWPVGDQAQFGWIGAAIVPLDCFGMASGSFATALDAAGLLRGVADLPESYHAAAAQKVETKVVRQRSAFVTSDEVTDFGFGRYSHLLHITITPGDFTTDAATQSATPLLSVSDFPWCKISELKAYAEARGWKFIHQVYGVPLKLEVFDLPMTVASVLRQPTATVQKGTFRRPDPNPDYTGQTVELTDSFTMRSKYASFYESLDAEWIAVRPVNDDRSYFIACEASAIAPDALAAGTFGQGVVEFEAPEHLRRQIAETTYGKYYTWWIQFPTPANPSGVRGEVSVQRPVTDDVYATRMILRDASSASVARSHKVALIPTDTIQTVAEFSKTSAAAAWARRQPQGAEVLPFTRIPAAGDTIYLNADESGNADLTGYNGRRAVFLVDNTTAIT